MMTLSGLKNLIRGDWIIEGRGKRTEEVRRKFYDEEKWS